MLRIDNHVHTNFSNDSNAKMEDMVKTAIYEGLEEITFTDHYDYIYPTELFPYQIDYAKYRQSFDAIKEKYSAQIYLNYGIEIGINPMIKDVISKFINEQKFDFVIASIHDIEGKDLYVHKFFRGKEKREAFEYYITYFKKSLDAIDDFCVVGHFDFISRYNEYENRFMEYLDYKEHIDDFLKYVIKRGKGLEINTSGYRYGIGKCYPDIEILRKYRDLGGKIITIGSDAHKPSDIGKNFNEAVELAKSAGFKQACKFRELKPIFFDI